MVSARGTDPRYATEVPSEIVGIIVFYQQFLRSEITKFKSPNF